VVAVTEELAVRRLVLSAKAGDHDAMRGLYGRFAPHVHDCVRRIVVNPDDADDLTQQIFAKLLTELWRYEPGEAPFRAWILRVAHNAAIDHVRQTRAFPCAEIRTIHEHVDEPPIERRASLREALASLTAAQRNVLVLRHVMGFTPDEIAARLGRSAHSVRCLHQRGRAAACRALDELESAPATVGRPVPAEAGKNIVDRAASSRVVSGGKP
jgi:RNA polymerase sigma-70 factor (ECF subfamily)